MTVELTREETVPEVPPPAHLDLVGITDLAKMWRVNRSWLEAERHAGRLPEPDQVVGIAVVGRMPVWARARFTGWQPTVTTEGTWPAKDSLRIPAGVIPPPDGSIPPLVGIGEMSAMFGLYSDSSGGHGTAYTWRYRGRLPEEDTTVSRKPLWIRSRLITWAVITRPWMFDPDAPPAAGGQQVTYADLPPDLQAVARDWHHTE